MNKYLFGFIIINYQVKVRLLKILIPIFSLVLVLSGCVVSNRKFFADVRPAEDPTYGYTAENPINIKNANLNSSIGSSYYYLSRLRTEKGNKLQLIQRFSINNPNYIESAVPLTNRYNSKSINHGSGQLLDYYMLIPENESDTIRLYINPYLKGKIEIPGGLKFEKEQ